MTRTDRCACIVLAILGVLIVCEAEAQAPSSSEETPLVRVSAGGSTPMGLQPEPRCDAPVVTWSTDGLQERTCGEWRCLTRRAWADQVMTPERELTRCADNLRTERKLSAQLVEAHRAALEDAAEAREAEQRMRRRRWAYVAAGAAGGVLVSACVVWAGVQVVGAR